MSQTIFTNQDPDASVIVGAYFGWFSQPKHDQKFEQLEYSAFNNRSIYHSAVATARGPSLKDAQKFKRLITRWRSERDATSSVTEMVMHESYQKMIAMGEVAIPLILSELRSEGDEPDHWFWALCVLTEADPVADEDRGNIVRMAKAWAKWGESQGYAR